MHADCDGAMGDLSTYLDCRRLLDDGEMSKAVQALRLVVAVETLRLALRHVGCWGHVREVSHT